MDSSSLYRWIVLGNPDNRRVTAFQRALTASGAAPPQVVGWRTWLDEPDVLRALLGPDAIVRIESMGEDVEVERQLLMRGVGGRGACMTRAAVEALVPDRGRILAPAQWWAGFEDAMLSLQQILEEHDVAAVMNPPADILAMFDKRVMHQRLQRGGVPVPPRLDEDAPITSYAMLRERMAQRGCPQVFVKLRYGSSASGVIAYRAHGDREVAVTSTRITERGGHRHLYNSLEIQRYTDHEAIAHIIDRLATEGVVVERWLPKAHI